jgi:hypothetical protein
MLTDVSEVRTASIIRAMSEPLKSAEFYLTLTLYLSLSSTMDCPAICHWPTFSPIATHSPLVSPVHLYSYITCYPFTRTSLITLIMEAVHTSETSVNIYLTTLQYIPEDSKLQLIKCLSISALLCSIVTVLS